MNDFLSSSYWVGSVVVRARDLRSAGREFDSQPLHCHGVKLGKSLTHVPSASEVTAVWRRRNVMNLILFHFILF